MVLILKASALFFAGCAKPQDTDVTASPKYNFSAFAGTVWKTKVEVALADVKRYTGEQALDLIAPQGFDPAHPKYTPVQNMRLIAVLPVGTHLRIGGLMKDNGNWGGVRVAATLQDGTNAQRTVYLDNRLLAKNRFIWEGWSSSTNWDVDPNMLEK